MSKHLTVRMAWHDNNWNGKVCCDPEKNTYCTGAHSLLSGRIEKKKDTALEQGLNGQAIAGNFDPANVPPCYWSINAFGESDFKVEHHHAFKWVKHVIPDRVKPYSVFTWPFKLSFNHGKEKQNQQGNYPPDLDLRIENFTRLFKPRESLIFFYANYDNPVSADDMKYLLLGCSLISELPEPKHFPFTKKELENTKAPKTRKDGSVDIQMKHFPTMNWAIQFSHDPKESVMLPYKEYVKYAEEHPEDELKLHDMKVIIEEESLVRGFKYVAMDIDDDKSLFLLYKLRKSIKVIQEHNQLVINEDLKKQEEQVENLIKLLWENRGIYPSLDKVLCHFLGDDLVKDLSQRIKSILSPKYDLLNLFKEIKDENIPEELEDFEDDLLDLSDKRLFSKNIESLARLSLFDLTTYQVDKIINDNSLRNKVAKNPYVLYEKYEADEDDLDKTEMQDEPIDVFKIDIGMIPDRKYVKRHRGLQNLAEDSAERIRSVIINYLWRIGEKGHCYDHTHNILKDVKEYPLIYKNEVSIDEEALIELDSDYKSHFIQNLHVEKGDGQDYYYLRSIKEAENKIKNVIDTLIKRKDHQGDFFDYQKHINESLATKPLSEIITNAHDIDQFTSERSQLFSNIFKKSFFLLTGKPGAGKTYEASQIIKELIDLREEIEILAPTGKAALRLSENIKKYAGKETVQASTIDKFIYDKKFNWAYDDPNRLADLDEIEKLTIENLIIDESSMLDLPKLNILFSIIRFTDKYPKRIIMVGDENQLPPIGFGKPFHDIINFILSKANLADKHYINLVSNCRQENDEKILTLAEAFTDKKRYYEEALELAEKEGWISDGLYIKKWGNQKELHESIEDSFSDLLSKENIDASYNDFERLNLLFGLYENGFVNNQDYKFRDHLNIEKFQILTPYRPAYFGTTGLNKLFQSKFRERDTSGNTQKYFYHADKIMRLYNWYWGKGENRRLVLSNGSIGTVTVKSGSFENEQGQEIHYDNRKYYFTDAERVFSKVDDEENFDLAYAISVHKSQGSDFRNVFLVIPKKQSLLSKELIYTALTRSKFRLYLFIQGDEVDILNKARTTSHLISRNTSIFERPTDKRKDLIPVAGGPSVRSRIEYIIYQALERSGLEFSYEKKLMLEKRKYDIHPDFTIKLKDGRTIYWEHLGMLDTRKYYKDWQQRILDYSDHEKFEFVVTTDDLDGINDEKIEKVIEDIRENNLVFDKNNKFSLHHYELY